MAAGDGGGGAGLVARLQALADQTAGRMRTGQDWQTALDHAARLPRVSFTNAALLIPAQMGAVRVTRVADAATWRVWGRQVRAGHRGLGVLVRLPHPAGVVVRATRVFDVSHTTGAARPVLPARGVASPGRVSARLWDALVRQAAVAGVLVVRDSAGSGPAGVTDPGSRTIHIRLGLSDVDEVAALGHELGHVLLRHDLGGGRCGGVAAVEADSVAYLVLARAGVDVSGWRFPPVAGWAAGAAQVRAVGERVVATAGAVTARIAAEQATSVDRDWVRGVAVGVRDGARHTVGVAAQVQAAVRADRDAAVVVAEPVPERLVRAVETAAAFYTAALRRSGAAMAYLRARDLEWAVGPGSPWVIGYAPPQWTALSWHLHDRGFTTAEAVDAGLVALGETGRARDWCAGRLVFGVRDGRLPGAPVVGFTGRALDGREPKYLNTRTTALYRKGELWFGLAEQQGRAAGWTPVIVEGPTDALAVARMGDRFAGLGLCGTALTPAQAETVTDAAGRGDRILVAFDGDETGRARAESVFHTLAGVLDRRAAATGYTPTTVSAHVRALAGHRLLTVGDPGCRVDAVVLPDGADPASLGSRALWQALTADLPRLDQVIVDQRITPALRPDADVVTRARAIRAAAGFIATRPDPTDIARLGTRVTQQLGLDPGLMPDLILDRLRAQTAAPAQLAARAKGHATPPRGRGGGGTARAATPVIPTPRDHHAGRG